MQDKSPIRALGLMSGTSLDGVDGAVCVTDGEQIFGFEKSFFRPYSDSERAELRSCLGKWEGDNTLGNAHEIIHSAHLKVIEQFPDADVIGFHGQTLSHDPENGRTFQMGDGAALALACGKDVVWDFRSEDVRMGGQGAPLAPFFHFACAKQLGLKAPIAFVNLGGVGNVTFVDPSKPKPEDTGALLAFDTGPANAPLNDLVESECGLAYDKDSSIALKGAINGAVLERFFKNPYFEKSAPKSLDRDDFSELPDLLDGLSLNDKAATLTAIISSSVYAGQMHFPSDPSRWLICGGGRNNPMVMQGLKNSIAQPLDKVEAVGFDGDMFEAQAFGYLAVRVLHGLPTSAPGTTGVSAPVCGGKISKAGL